MAEHLFRNWPVYVLLVGVIWFFVYVVTSGNKAQKDSKQDQHNVKNKDEVR